MVHYRTINHDKKFIAFFSPKCGYTTLKAWFIASLEFDQSIEHNSLGADRRRNVSSYMIPACDVDTFPDYRKILFIRDPFHRLVSFYLQFVIRQTRHWCFADDDGQESLKGKTFAELVAMLGDLARQGRPFQHHLQPQLEGVEGVEFDTIIPIERFDADIAVLNRELDINYVPKRLNATCYGTAQSGHLYDLKPRQIAKLGPPNRDMFYNEQLTAMVNSLYRHAIEFYELHSSASIAQRVSALGRAFLATLKAMGRH